MPRYYPKIIKCIVCGTERETFKHAKYCEKCALQVKMMQIRGHMAALRGGGKTKMKQTRAYIIKTCKECNNDYVPTNNSQNFCGEKCIYANNIEAFGLKKANDFACRRRSKKSNKENPPPPKTIKIPPVHIQNLTPEQITRYWGRII